MSNKLFKSELKQIVKECLIEILAEGIGTKNKRSNSERVNEIKNKTPRRSHLDNITYGKNKNSVNEKKIVKVKNTNITDNAIFNEILADTAKHTLQEQVAADRGSNSHHAQISSQGDKAAKIVSQNTPDQIFGQEASGKWAKLAFFDQ